MYFSFPSYTVHISESIRIHRISCHTKWWSTKLGEISWALYSWLAVCQMPDTSNGPLLLADDAQMYLLLRSGCCLVKTVTGLGTLDAQACVYLGTYLGRNVIESSSHCRISCFDALESITRSAIKVPE